ARQVRRTERKNCGEQCLANLPVWEVWQAWLADRSKNTRARDGCELLRAVFWYGETEKSLADRMEKLGDTWGDYLTHVRGGLTPAPLKHTHLVGAVLQWLLRMEPPTNGPAFLLDSLQTAFAMVPKKVPSVVGAANGNRTE